MIYKLLFYTSNPNNIEKIYIQMEDYDCRAVSNLKTDLINDIKDFQPHAYVHFIDGNAMNESFELFSLRNEPVLRELPVIIIGNKEDCKTFNDTISVDLIINKTTPQKKIEQSINSLLEKLVPPEIGAPVFTDDDVSMPDGLLDLLKSQGNRKHILVIDDDRNTLKLIKTYLSDSYDITTVTSGRMARRFFEKNTADLILLDYEMPEESGVEVYKGFLNNEVTKDIPVIFLTGIAYKDKIKNALLLRPKGYLLKPINVKRLKEVLDETFLSL